MKTTENKSGVKIICKNVDVRVDDGLYYIVIYELRGVKPNCDVVTLDRYLNKKDADNMINFCYEHYKSLYDCFFVREQWVWC